MPLAHIELMMADRPVTVYPKTDTVEMGKGKSRKFTRPRQSALDNANARWAARLEERRKKKPMSNPS